MPSIRRLCVYCGSSLGVAPQHRAAAAELGERLATAGIGLVFGGGRVGLMGVLADAALAAGGHVTGIIPAGLRDAELAHRGVSELVVVANMHERKRQMAERADAFAVLPGGIGTLDETFEIMTWHQLGLHSKPVWIVDIGGYWQPLLKIFDHLTAEGFAVALVPQIARLAPSVAALIEALQAVQSAPAGLRTDLV
ncbi:MAG: TIGR00730 family Rossman fold protein [Alphaproteobacteria bacterium]|nr:TIGR00730 family Rossman fold protein [Alphaproteobacteria bacterium]